MSLSEKVYSLNLTIFILSFLKVNFADQFLLRRVVMRPDRLCLIKKKKVRKNKEYATFSSVRILLLSLLLFTALLFYWCEVGAVPASNQIPILCQCCNFVQLL